VHPGAEGHRLMAQPVLEAWGLEAHPDGTPVHAQGAAILKAIQQKQALLKPAWLSETGHLRPGVAAGLPLAEAEAKAAVFEAEARRLATAVSPEAVPADPPAPGKSAHRAGNSPLTETTLALRGD
jgi:hypothetical protein